MSQEKFSLTYEDEFGEVHKVEFLEDEYANLMELIFDRCSEDWGDCKGRAWCGTCHIHVLKGELHQNTTAEEQMKLEEVFLKTATSRLACQLFLKEDINGVHFRIVGD